MPRRPSLPRRLRTATRWPVGIVLTSWRYMWRTTPFHRSETTGSWEEDGPPDLPDGIDRSEVQYARAGAGPLFHRVYRGRIRGTTVSPEVLVDTIAADLDRVAPSEFASFNKVLGDEGTM